MLFMCDITRSRKIEIDARIQYTRNFFCLFRVLLVRLCWRGVFYGSKYIPSIRKHLCTKHHILRIQQKKTINKLITVKSRLTTDQYGLQRDLLLFLLIILQKINFLKKIPKKNDFFFKTRKKHCQSAVKDVCL